MSDLKLLLKLDVVPRKSNSSLLGVVVTLLGCHKHHMSEAKTTLCLPQWWNLTINFPTISVSLTVAYQAAPISLDSLSTCNHSFLVLILITNVYSQTTYYSSYHMCSLQNGYKKIDGATEFIEALLKAEARS